MTGRKHREQASLFYEFRLDDMIPKGHLLRRINVFVTSVLGDLHEQLGPFYSDIGRPSIDPELLIRMLIIGYCFGNLLLREEAMRGLPCIHRRFCRLDLNDAVPHHSTFPENRLNRFRRERYSAPHFRARRHRCDGDGSRQRRGICRGCERHGGERKPLSRQGAR